MPFHPNPLAMAVHVEHHRQELLAQAQQERLTKEAINGRPSVGRGPSGLKTVIATGLRNVVARWRPEMVKPMEFPQSTTGDAT
jgi:hypothetical protein